MWLARLSAKYPRRGVWLAKHPCMDLVRFSGARARWSREWQSVSCWSSYCIELSWCQELVVVISVLPVCIGAVVAEVFIPAFGQRLAEESTYWCEYRILVYLKFRLFACSIASLLFEICELLLYCPLWSNWLLNVSTLRISRTYVGYVFVFCSIYTLWHFAV